jgi:polysaccharide export outer membrane protein
MGSRSAQAFLHATLLVSLGCVSSGGNTEGPAPVGLALPPASSSSAAPQPIELRAEASGRASRDAYHIGPEDRIEVRVFGAERLSGPFTVSDDGRLSLPLLGPVQAAGYTPTELEHALEERLRATYMRDPHVTVQVTEMRSQAVSVIGAVRRPGIYQVAGSATLLELLSLAEGLTPEAGGRAWVLRAGTHRSQPWAAGSENAAREATLSAQDSVLEVDLIALVEKGDARANLRIQPGDIVQVTPAGTVYVVGEVIRPGGYPLAGGRPLTVLQALALAQGLSGTAAAGRSMIVRTAEDGSRQEIPVDLGDVLDGSVPPPLLSAQDVLFVPDNEAKSVALGVVNALVRMVTLRGLVY